MQRLDSAEDERSNGGAGAWNRHHPAAGSSPKPRRGTKVQRLDRAEDERSNGGGGACNRRHPERNIRAGDSFLADRIGKTNVQFGLAF